MTITTKRLERGTFDWTKKAASRYSHYLVGPWNLGQRFLMHGFFTEYLHARLEEVRSSAELH